MVVNIVMMVMLLVVVIMMIADGVDAGNYSCGKGYYYGSIGDFYREGNFCADG